MKEETIKSIESYLKAHGLMTLATVTADGNPIAHSVEYVSEGNTVYFTTHGGMRKVANIKNNPNVGYTVDEDYPDWTKIQGIQMQGKASLLEDESEIQRIMAIYLEKFPQVKNFPPEFSSQMVLIKVEPVLGRFIDNSKGQGNTQIVEY